MELKKDYSLVPQLESLELKWVSKSRIFGQAIEDWVIENYTCECLSKYKTQKVNSKAIDAICYSCGNKIQIKGSKNIFKPNKYNELKIIGAEYKTTLNSIREDKWDLILVSYSKEQKYINQIMKIKSDQITEECVIARNPLKETARRAGWQGCYLNFKYNAVEVLYDNSLS